MSVTINAKYFFNNFTLHKKRLRCSYYSIDKFDNFSSTLQNARQNLKKKYKFPKLFTAKTFLNQSKNESSGSNKTDVPSPNKLPLTTS